MRIEKNPFLSNSNMEFKGVDFAVDEQQDDNPTLAQFIDSPDDYSDVSNKDFDLRYEDLNFVYENKDKLKSAGFSEEVIRETIADNDTSYSVSEYWDDVEKISASNPLGLTKKEKEWVAKKEQKQNAQAQEILAKGGSMKSKAYFNNAKSAASQGVEQQANLVAYADDKRKTLAEKTSNISSRRSKALTKLKKSISKSKTMTAKANGALAKVGLDKVKAVSAKVTQKGNEQGSQQVANQQVQGDVMTTSINNSADSVKIPPVAEGHVSKETVQENIKSQNSEKTAVAREKQIEAQEKIDAQNNDKKLDQVSKQEKIQKETQQNQKKQVKTSPFVRKNVENNEAQQVGKQIQSDTKKNVSDCEKCVKCTEADAKKAEADTEDYVERNVQTDKDSKDNTALVALGWTGTGVGAAVGIAGVALLCCGVTAAIGIAMIAAGVAICGVGIVGVCAGTDAQEETNTVITETVHKAEESEQDIKETEEKVEDQVKNIDAVEKRNIKQEKQINEILKKQNEQESAQNGGISVA